ncbi:hypothetical protein ACJIZ3_003703 [Penstemon smallii]|uniref:cytokinin riboside 5'-monophosphate phosphoribohydrolase n=1 Tax=Penstemon smallii TaxID=265156 RepID=A0ABD3UBH1_9LAMI
MTDALRGRAVVPKLASHLNLLLTKFRNNFPKTLIYEGVSGPKQLRLQIQIHNLRRAHNLRRGYGTLEELLEVITWAQLGIHDKPVGLLNVDGYYNSLLSFIDKAVEERFISPSERHIIVSAPSTKELVNKLEEYVPRHIRVASKLSWEMQLRRDRAVDPGN